MKNALTTVLISIVLVSCTYPEVDERMEYWAGATIEVQDLESAKEYFSREGISYNTSYYENSISVYGLLETVTTGPWGSHCGNSKIYLEVTTNKETTVDEVIIRATGCP